MQCLDNFFPTVLEEATIMSTAGKQSGYDWDDTHPRLIDNAGIDGTCCANCAASRDDQDRRPWMSMTLDRPQKIMRVQLSFRKTGNANTLSHGKNVRVQVGSSSQYNPSDPVCTEIPQLPRTGPVDYDCDNYHVGQYVIFSNDQQYLDICEAKVFVRKSG